jgi:fibronectin-binding autotransporter adhesin
MVVAPTNDTVYTAGTTIALLDAQQVNGIILDRIGARHAGIADGQVAAAAPIGLMPGGVQLAQADTIGALGGLASALPQALAAEGAWFRGIGSFASVNGNASAPGFTGSTGGFLAGWDRPVADNLYLGAAGGYLHSDTAEHGAASGTEQSARVALYGGAVVGSNLFTGTIGYAHDWFHTDRSITGIGTASESHGGNEATAAGQWSRPLTVAGLGGGVATLTPKAGIEYVHLSEGAFGETGGSGFNLSSASRGADSLQPYVSGSLSQTFVTASGMQIAPELRLSYSHDLFNARFLTVTSVSGTSFPVTGVAPSRDQVAVGIGVVVLAAPNLNFYANYDTILHTGNTTEQTVQAGLRWKF